MLIIVSKFPPFHLNTHSLAGMGGNLAAVQASRISTSLHLVGTPGSKPPDSYQWHGILSFWRSKYYICVYTIQYSMYTHPSIHHYICVYHIYIPTHSVTNSRITS